jgi:hypothetical protein
MRKLSRSEPQREHVEAIETELFAKGNDRATAIMFGSFVEATLERLLAKQLRQDLNSDDRKKVFEYEGALGTFSSKTIMAYAMSLIGPVSRADLDLIRFLRNEFAHSRISFTFTTPEVSAVCAQLKIPNEPYHHIPFGYLQRVSSDELEAASDINHPRTRYITTCHQLSYRMQVKRDGPQAGDIAFPNDEPLP